MTIFANPLLKSLSFQQWKETLSELDEARLEEYCSLSNRTQSDIQAFAEQLGWKGNVNASGAWYKRLHNLEITQGNQHNLERKIQFHPVQVFIDNLKDEEKNTLYDHIERENSTLTDIYQHLKSIGCKESYSQVKKWYNDHLKVGDKARFINALMLDYKGLNGEAVLSGMIGDLYDLSDRVREGISDKQIEKEGLRHLPSLYRELRGAIEAQNSLRFIREANTLQRDAAMFVIERMKQLFEGTNLEETINRACQGIIEEMMTRLQGERDG